MARFRGLDWREVRLEDVGEFVAWLQLPLAGRSAVVVMLLSAVPQVGAATVNRKLAAVTAFYAHQARSGAEVGDLLAAWKVGGRGGWKPFLHRISKGKPVPCHNSHTGSELVFSVLVRPVVPLKFGCVPDLARYAAGWYSLISPPRSCRRRIWSGGAGKAMTPGASSGARRSSACPWWLRPVL